MSNIERIPRQEVSILTPADMLNNAVMSGADIVVLEKLMGLQERWEANQARKAFNEAIAQAKSEIPPIIKNSVVDYTTSKGRTNYKFESLAEIARVVDPILNKHGLTYRHRSEQSGKRLRVVCVLSHKDGYSEETSLEADEDNSGNKNAIQAVGSAATYLQRYTLKLALGLSTTADDDGRSTSVKTAPVDDMPAVEVFISADQAKQLRDALAFTGRNEAKFLEYIGVPSIENIYANKFDDCLKLIQGARK